MERPARAVMALIAALVATASEAQDRFDIAPPDSTGSVKQLWSTRYYVHYLTPVADSHASPLLHKDGRPFGIFVSNHDFCFGSLQGTIAIREDRYPAVYNVDGLVDRSLATCTFKGGTTDETNARLGRQAWVKLTGNGIYGLGARGWRLVPFRTIAVDPKVLPLGTVFYIPRLRGFRFRSEGAYRVHDGYVIAGDVGRSVVGNHVDFFTGNFTGPPPPFVTSSKADLFGARVVTKASTVSRLRAELRYAP